MANGAPELKDLFQSLPKEEQASRLLANRTQLKSILTRSNLPIEDRKKLAFGSLLGQSNPEESIRTSLSFLIGRETPGTFQERTARERLQRQVFDSPSSLYRAGTALGANVKQPEPEKSRFQQLLGVSELGSLVPAISRTLKGQRFSDAYKESQQDILRGIREGRPTEVETGADLLRQVTGLPKEQESLIGKALLATGGIALDILLDPKSYVTFGTGGLVGRVGARVGGKALTRAGQKEFQKIATEAGQLAASRIASNPKLEEEILVSAAKRTGIDINALKEMGFVRAAEEEAKADLVKFGDFNERLKPFLDPGGVKVFGKSVVTGDTIKKAAAFVGLTRAGKALSHTKFGELAKSFSDVSGSAFSRSFRVPKGAPRIITDEFFTAKQAADAKATERITSIFSDAGFTTQSPPKEMIVDAARAVDEGLIDSLTDERVKKLALSMEENLAFIAEEAQREGTLGRSMENYFPMIMKKPSEAIQPLIEVELETAGIRGFQKPRVFQTLREAEEAGIEIETDPIIALFHRFRAHENALAEKRYVDAMHEAIDRGALPGVELRTSQSLVKKLGEIDIDTEALQNRDLKEAVFTDTNIPTELLTFPRQLNDGTITNIKTRVPSFVVEAINEGKSQGVSNDVLNALVRNYDKFLNFQKGSLTSPFPAFHARNSLGNVMLSGLDIALSAINPKKHMEAIQVLRGKGGGIVDDFGTKWSTQDINAAMESLGILRKDFFGADLSKNPKQFLDEALKGKRGVIKTAAVPTPKRVIQAGRLFGSMVEDEARALHFIETLRRSGSIQEAARRTNKYLFDYSNLSQFEKKVMKRLFPFYTFTRKNAELQLQTLLTEPGRVFAELKAVSGLTDRASQEELEGLPEWARNDFTFKVPFSDLYGRPIMLGGLGSPISEFVQSFTKPLDKVESLITPPVRAAMELKAGKDFFTGRDLEDLNVSTAALVLPEPIKTFLNVREIEKPVFLKGKVIDTKKQVVVDPRAMFIIRSLPTSRIIGSVEQMSDDRKSSLERAIKFTTGLTQYSVDKEQQRYFEDIDKIINIAKQLRRQRYLKQNAKTGELEFVNPNLGQVIALDDLIKNLDYDVRPTELEYLTRLAIMGDPGAIIAMERIEKDPSIIVEVAGLKRQFIPKPSGTEAITPVLGQSVLGSLQELAASNEAKSKQTSRELFTK